MLERFSDNHRWLRVTAPSWCVVFALSACAEPRYESGDCERDCDATVGVDTPRDGAAASAEPGSWQEQLRGSYGLRIRNYSRVPGIEGLAVLVNEVIWRAEVEVDARGEVIMQTRYCHDRTQVGMSFLGESWAEMINPEAMPSREFELIYENDQFRTQGAEALLGYREESPPACSSARTAPALPEQVWMRNGLCECPTTASPPTNPNDCRVSNPDGDAYPGYTIRLSGAFTGFDYIRNRDASQFVQGRLDPQKRHSAVYVRNYDFYQLGCARPPCARTSPEACPGVPNVVEFAPVSPTTSCAEVVQQADRGALFTPEPLRAPPACSR